MEKIWEFEHSSSVLGLELGDINNNGQLEIVAFTKAGEILILNLDGNLLFKDEIIKESPIWHVKSYKDKIFVGGLDGLLRVFNCLDDYTLEADWAQQFGGSISGIIIDDINSDGREEIIVYSIDKTIRVLNPLNGDLVWGQAFEDGVGDVVVWKDDSKPNYKELYACGNDGTIRAFNGNNGELLWFKRFSDKVRCINYFNSSQGKLIVCGGDDKKIYFIEKGGNGDIKSISFEEYVWKCKVFPPLERENVLISSYSFAYLDESVNIEDINFTSKMICVNKELEIIWELQNKNVEIMDYLPNDNVICGTTSGELILLKADEGEILSIQNLESCINSIKVNEKNNLTVICQDNGKIIAY